MNADRRRKLIERLEATAADRSGPEAEAFRAKAAELRAQQEASSKASPMPKPSIRPESRPPWYDDAPPRPTYYPERPSSLSIWSVATVAGRYSMYAVGDGLIAIIMVYMFAKFAAQGVARAFRAADKAACQIVFGDCRRP